MAWREVTWEGGNWEVSWGGQDIAVVVRLGGGEHSWALRAFTLVLLSYPQKVRNGIMIEDVREIRFQRSLV